MPKTKQFWEQVLAVFKTTSTTLSDLLRWENPVVETTAPFLTQRSPLLIIKLFPDRETSKTSFFPSVLSSMSFKSQSWQLRPEEEDKLRTSASLLHGDMAGILTQGVRLIWQDKPRVLSERSKNVPPSLWLVSSVHHVFSLTVMHCVGGIECPVKSGKRRPRRKERDKEREREGNESDPWPLRPCDVSGAGRGCNWEWHSWLELPNCHFLSSLFTHSGSLSRTFEEQRTDVCLLVQHRFWLSLLWFTTTLSTSRSNHHLRNKDRKMRREWKESSVMGRVRVLFLVIDWNIQLFFLSFCHHCSLCSTPYASSGVSFDLGVLAGSARSNCRRIGEIGLIILMFCVEEPYNFVRIKFVTLPLLLSPLIALFFSFPASLIMLLSEMGHFHQYK